MAKAKAPSSWSMLPAEVKKAVARYGVASADMSWKGGMDPESWPEVERKLKESKEQLARAILKLAK